MISNTVSFRVVLCGGTDPNMKSRAMVKGTAIAIINHQIKVQVQGVQKK